MTQLIQAAHEALLARAQTGKTEVLSRFFKTGKGQYGEGDQFLGVTVPMVRQVVRQFASLPLTACEELLNSPYNEARLLALLILVKQYSKGGESNREAIYQSYLAHRNRVNNWNLVDSSAPYILGAHLLSRDRQVLYVLARSPVLWDRRIAVLSAFAFIRAGDFEDTLRLTEMLLSDPQDLMHKACGWMLRELGKRDVVVLAAFLRQHQRTMPRTMLRYAIERFSPDQRRALLAGVY